MRQHKRQVINVFQTFFFRKKEKRFCITIEENVIMHLNFNNLFNIWKEKGRTLKERKLGLYNKVRLFSLLIQQSPDIIRPLTKDKATWYNPFDMMEME